MESVLMNIFTLILIVQFFIGNLSNGFTVLISCIDLANRRRLSTADQILTGLAISRIGLLWEILISWFEFRHYSAFFVHGLQLRIIIFAWIITNHLSIWLATILSVFYLLKIASFSSHIFLYLKWRVEKLILVILLGSLVFLFLNILQMNLYINEWMHMHETSTTWNSTQGDATEFSGWLLLTMTIYTLIPFTVALMAFLLLIFSLRKHLNRMQLSSQGYKDLRSKAHINALKMVISFLLLYAIFCLSILISWIGSTYKNDQLQKIGQIIGTVYPSSHSFILILGNPKLRKTTLWYRGC
ncbi:taste receptor type 2 member 13 [Echinops telfairi]|uniref:Taste receptor type 2 n=1 Tax=Echinops telfairi TaxID=9371 RepID=A0ABM0ZU21_ECHTE|nr:taste receptor type 2 member 13 [Echinops telfairi]